MAVVKYTGLLLLFLLLPKLLWAGVQWSSLQLDAATWHLSAQDVQQLSAGQVVLHKQPASEDKVQHVDAFLLIHAPVDHIFKLITDYPQLMDYAPHVVGIQVRQQSEHDALVNYSLSLPLGVKKQYQLHLDFSAQGNNKRMAWKATDWKPQDIDQRIGDTSGYWHLLATANPQLTLLAYRTITDPGDVPFGLGWIVEYLTDTTIAELLNNTKLRAEKQWQAMQSGHPELQLTTTRR